MLEVKGQMILSELEGDDLDELNAYCLWFSRRDDKYTFMPETLDLIYRYH